MILPICIGGIESVRLHVEAGSGYDGGKCRITININLGPIGRMNDFDESQSASV